MKISADNKSCKERGRLHTHYIYNKFKAIEHDKENDYVNKMNETDESNGFIDIENHSCLVNSFFSVKSLQLDNTI